MKYSNEVYNDFCLKYCDSKNKSDKIIPYMGWFWRKVDFNSRSIPISKCLNPYFVAITISNKWDYDERDMFNDEIDYLEILLNRCIETNDEDEIYKILACLHSFIQNLKV